MIRKLFSRIINKQSEVHTVNQSIYTKDYFNEINITIGDYTYGKPKILDWGEGALLTIGKYCSIADDVIIMLGGEHRMDWVSTYPFTVLNDKAKHITGHPKTKGNVEIENDVWIGRGALITSGVKIGNGAVIGANSVVTKNVEPYEVVGGNPARHIKYRFDETTRVKLLEINWWDWSTEKIESNLDFLLNPFNEILIK